MTLDIDKYRVNVPAIRLATEGKSDEEKMRLIGELAVSTLVPIIAVACFVGELYGFDPELRAFIKRLMAFYKITEVTGVKDTDLGQDVEVLGDGSRCIRKSLQHGGCGGNLTGL
jgi:hypothetical protein